jgi:hypothetical protein
MSALARISAVAIAAALSGASLAHAESALTATTTGLSGAASQSVLQSVHKTLQWDDKGRWSLKLDMNEPAGRGIQLRDIQAGAYYHVTPSLKVGGAVSLGDNLVQPDRTNLPQNQAPRVRLETSFKF